MTHTRDPHQELEDLDARLFFGDVFRDVAREISLSRL